MNHGFRNIILILLCLIIIVVFFILIISDDPKEEKEIVYRHEKDNYQVYDVDQLVKLKDDSEWYVLKDNNTKDKDISLISKNIISSEKIEDITYYLDEVYIDKICNSLSISRNQINEIRLLNEHDIFDLYDIEEDGFDNNFDTSKYKMLDIDTLAQYMIDGQRASLCDNGFCINNSNDIRVVINLPKYFIKEQ